MSAPQMAKPLAARQAWKAPKALVGPTVISKVLSRHTATHGPETRLVVAVITRAIDDCRGACTRPRRAARRFVLGESLGWWCDLVGLDADFVRLVAKKAGYLADDCLAKTAREPKAAARQAATSQSANNKTGTATQPRTIGEHA